MYWVLNLKKKWINSLNYQLKLIYSSKFQISVLVIFFGKMIFCLVLTDRSRRHSEQRLPSRRLSDKPPHKNETRRIAMNTENTMLFTKNWDSIPQMAIWIEFWYMKAIVHVFYQRKNTWWGHSPTSASSPFRINGTKCSDRNAREDVAKSSTHNTRYMMPEHFIFGKKLCRLK